MRVYTEMQTNPSSFKMHDLLISEDKVTCMLWRSQNESGAIKSFY